jgi:hypothetical protein
MKQALYLRAAGADVVLDLHCDSSAVLHMYTHDRLWYVCFPARTVRPGQ